MNLVNFLSAFGSVYSGAFGFNLISITEWLYSPTPGFLFPEGANLTIFGSI